MKKTKKKEIVIEKMVDSYFCDMCGKHINDIAWDDDLAISGDTPIPDIDDPRVNYRIKLPNGYYFSVLLCDDCKKKMHELENRYCHEILSRMRHMEESEKMRFIDIAGLS